MAVKQKDKRCITESVFYKELINKIKGSSTCLVMVTIERVTDLGKVMVSKNTLECKDLKGELERICSSYNLWCEMYTPTEGNVVRLISGVRVDILTVEVVGIKNKEGVNK